MTNRKRMVAIVMLVFVTCLMVAWLSETVYAAVDDDEDEGRRRRSASAEDVERQAQSTSMMEKKGIEGVFAGKSLDASRAPTRTQWWMGVGSIFVMVAVVKYL